MHAKQPWRYVTSMLAVIAGNQLVSAEAPSTPEMTLRELGENPAATPFMYRFHRDHILGTSFDMVVIATSRDIAEAAEAASLAEIERLRAILSTYDATSELSRLNANGMLADVSPDLYRVLIDCMKWQQRTQGAFNINVARMQQIWRDAEAQDQLPDHAELRRLADAIERPTWRFAGSDRVQKLSDDAISIDAYAKGYIVQAAIDAARRQTFGIRGIMVSIGGDLAVWGSSSMAGHTPWRIALADPDESEDNAKPMMRIAVRSGAVATSAHYARHYHIGGHDYSHLIDPRSGQPVNEVASVTVVAGDAGEADALATAVAVLGPAQGLRLIERTPGAECLIIGEDTAHHQSRGWASIVIAEPRPQVEDADDATATTNAWPAGFEVDIHLSVSNQSKRGNWPFVAVWIEDAKGELVRSLAQWGNEAKYVRHLKKYRRQLRESDGDHASSRASRAPGRYHLIWDGRDEQGNRVRQGVYVVRVESDRQNGKYEYESGKIKCLAEPDRESFNAGGSVASVSVQYGAK